MLKSDPGPMKRLSADQLGMVEMPMRLLIATTITALVLPVFWSAYEDLSLKRAENGLGGEMEELLDTVRGVMDGGVGSYQEVEIEVPTGMGIGLDDLVIGGPLNGEERWTSFTIRYRFRGEGWAILTTDPPIPMSRGDLKGGLEPTKEFRVGIMHEVIEGDHIAILQIVR